MAALTCAYESARQAGGVLPAWAPELAWHSNEPEVLTSFALSLLLVFRTNSSYARWDEGRRRFGCITTTCR